ncbi:nucleotide sugar dehydrogenase [Natronosalvus rutilus]|uniref:UDP-N-acetyl-D-mannosamine dehydrogenase n=1 Tax=Natronosalvus rutilus TaxID=2953753 RepID=A0A9E7SW11_9EURY|nr:nucleotide sugar dehydrogenase [Natronosalvus rutilus]UTF55015.1 nucleotide sugar dehydrogenase [Natronosalvus rutilus]
MSRATTALYGGPDDEPARRRALTNGSVPVAVYGLGKMGLPLAAVFAEGTGAVTGVDIDPAVVESVNGGRSHVGGEPGLDDLVAEQVSRGRLRATTDGAAAASEARVHVIIVPTLITDDDEPDLSTIEAVLEDVASGLEPGDLVIAESTLPPGTCRDVIAPHLAERSGLESGSFGVAFCPERTASGTALRDIRGQYPKVVGGVDEASGRAAALVYDELSANAVHLVSDATTAEAVKVFEGVYRDVNIALANQLAGTADDLGISVREAIETANHIPMCHLHDPGPGVGGHCIPYYPHFLLAQTEAPLSMVELGREVNREMPARTVSMLEAALNDSGTDESERDSHGEEPAGSLEDATVLVFGFTYRPGVEETRASPAIGVVESLRERGAEVWGCDPLVNPADFGARSIDVEDLVSGPTFDAAILVTPQDAFERIPWADLEPMVVLDGRDVLSLSNTDHRVVTLGGARDGRPTVIDGDVPTETDTSTIGRPATFDATGR